MLLNFTKKLITAPLARLFIITISCILCLGVLYRQQIFNNFSVLPGDRYDTVIVVTILEHWYRVFFEGINWLNAHYFYPYSNTIAHTDAYFLVAIPYVPFRFLGFDPFLSALFASWIIKASGFLGIYILCRKVFKFDFPWSLLAAILFTLSNNMTVHNQRIQLATVAFAPILTIMLWNTYYFFQQEKRGKFISWGCVSGMFFGAWCLTCFYMSFFFVYFFVFLLIFLAIVANKKTLIDFLHKLKSQFFSLSLILFMAIVSILPFLYAYLSKSEETGVRSYEKAFQYTVPLEGVLQVGRENLLFGKLYNSILSKVSSNYTAIGEYYNTGFNFLIFALFIVGALHTFIYHRKNHEKQFIKAIILTTVVTWMLTLRVNDYSAWYFVYNYFPGAKALRVISAYQIFLAFPVILICIKFLSEMKASTPVILVMAIFLIAGELNAPHCALNRKLEIQRISDIENPPEECSSFYVSSWRESENYNSRIYQHYAHNVSAMLIAQQINLPTINGIASFNPPDWNFSYPNLRKDYQERVFEYANNHDIHQLCHLDLKTKQWSLMR